MSALLWVADGCLLTCLFPRCAPRKRVGAQCLSLFLKDIDPSDLGPTIMTSCNPNYLPKAPFPNTFTLAIMASPYEFGAHKHSVCHNRLRNMLVSLLINKKVEIPSIMKNEDSFY